MLDADWNCACDVTRLRSVEIAFDSFALSRADSRFGIAIAAMIAMMAITIISSMSVKPSFLLTMGWELLCKLRRRMTETIVSVVSSNLELAARIAPTVSTVARLLRVHQTPDLAFELFGYAATAPLFGKDAGLAQGVFEATQIDEH